MSIVDAEARTRLSWMWVFVVLCMIFADIFSFMTPDFLAQVMDGRAGEITISREFLLLVAVVTAIPIAMIPLTQVLPRRASRVANVVVGALTVVYVWVGGATSLPHYVLFASLETLACLEVVRSAYRWQVADPRAGARELATA